MSDFFDDLISDPLKLWGSIIVVASVFFFVFHSSEEVATSDPFAESSFVSQEDMQYEEDEDYFPEDEDEDEESFTEEKSGFNDDEVFFQEPVFSKTGEITYKKYDQFGKEIKKPKKVSKDQEIEELKQRVKTLESKINKDPFASF